MARANADRFIQAAMTATSAAEAPDPTLCPRCQRPLMDPFGLGLCSACGYCRSLQQIRPESEKPTEKARGGGKPEADTLPDKNEPARGRFLSGTIVAIGGSVVVLLAFGLLTILLPGTSPLRLTVSRWAILAGMAAIGGCHCLAYRLVRLSMPPPISREGVKPPSPLSPLAVVVVWRRMLELLPRTRWLLVGLAWGVSALVGGAMVRAPQLVHSLDGGAPSKPTVADQAANAHRQRERQQEQQFALDTLNRLTGQPGKPGYQPRIAPPNPTPIQSVGPSSRPRPTEVDSRPVSPGVILGYTTNSSHQLTGLVVGALNDGKLVVGVIAEGLDLDQRVALHLKLKDLQRSEPLVSVSGVRALWVSPKVYCEIHHSGAGPNGQLSRPRYRALIDT